MRGWKKHGHSRYHPALVQVGTISRYCRVGACVLGIIHFRRFQGSTTPEMTTRFLHAIRFSRREGGRLAFPRLMNRLTQYFTLFSPANDSFLFPVHGHAIKREKGQALATSDLPRARQIGRLEPRICKYKSRTGQIGICPINIINRARAGLSVAAALRRDKVHLNKKGTVIPRSFHCREAREIRNAESLLRIQDNRSAARRLHNRARCVH